MARAKRTDRAEARRRSRALSAPRAASEIAEDGPEAPAQAAKARPAAATVERPSVAAAFRSSFRPLDLRGDLRALPQIVTHWSFFVPVILAGLSVALIPFLGAGSIAGVLFGYFSGAAPFGMAFIAGLFAPRASYLVGILAGLASVGFMALAFAVGPFGGALEGMRDVSGNPVSVDQAKSLLLNEALFSGVPLSAIVAAAGAWYRRFLNRANPNRSRPAATTSRRPDGKIPRKQEPRPMLARRR